MKRSLPIILLGFAFNSFAQTTVTIRPHFNGIESGIERADSTNPAWYGSPAQYDDIVADSTNPILTYMGWTSSGCPIVTRSLIRFADLTNTSVIPPGNEIVSAKLYLYGVPSTPTGDFGNSTYPSSPYNSYGTNDGMIYELAAPFNPNTTDWNTQPGILHTDSVAIPPSTMHWGGNDTLDVTTITADLFAHGNYGFELRTQTEVHYRERIFASSRYSDSTLHPALQVTYKKCSFCPPTGVSSINKSLTTLEIIPNPVQSELNAMITVPDNTTMSVNIYGLIGQKVYSNTQNCIPGINTLKIPVNNLTPGIYVIDISNESTIIKQKFIKQ